jgi:two-component system, OmpR family, KDP operon response regulator KdpE
MAETILVIGSQPVDEQSVIWDLLNADFQVRYAASDSKAIRIVAIETPSAVLLTQESDKAQKICSSIRRVAPALPLLVIGHEDDTAIRVRFFQADADDYILKPFDSAELIARIRSAVRRSKMVS